MKKRFLAMLLAIVMLLGLLTACGEQASVTESTPSLQTPAVSSSVDTTPSTTSTESKETAEPSSSTESKETAEPSSSTESTETVEPSSSTESKETVDPADHIFPDLEAFLGLSLEKDHAHGARGWRWQFEDIEPYGQLEAVKSELLTLLQEPRWQLELVDEQHSVYETGDMSGSDRYYFKYTGTAKLTQIEDYLGVRLDHVNVVFYHIAVYDKYTIDIFRSPELEAVDPGSRVSADVGSPPKEGGSDDNDFGKKCSACHGSGKCTHCGGDDEVRKFQPGLGWVEQNCTFCTGGRCRYCNGTGKD